MRFLLDIPIGRATAEYLRGAGHDCSFARERLSPRASDPDIVRCAAAEGRIVVCFDLDMATLVALSREHLPSVITFRTVRQYPPYINQRLSEVLPLIAKDLDVGVLATVDELRVRLRRLPVTEQ